MSDVTVYAPGEGNLSVYVAIRGQMVELSVVEARRLATDLQQAAATASGDVEEMSYFSPWPDERPVPASPEDIRRSLSVPRPFPIFQVVEEVAPGGPQYVLDVTPDPLVYRIDVEESGNG